MLYGPEDLDFTLYGVDAVASRKIALTTWASLSPYAGVSTYLANSHETTTAVNLDDERVIGAHGMVGAVMALSKARLALEYSAAKVGTFSLQLGIGW